jgi:hypothetical protein
MNNDWIMFRRDGKIVIDVSIGVCKDLTYPYEESDVTPHYGLVASRSILRRRVAG